MIGLKNMLSRKDSLLEEENQSEKFAYILLKLPRSKITEEFETLINDKLGDNFTKPKIEVASINDVERLANLYNRSFLTSGAPFRKMTPELLLNLFKDPKCNILIARVYGSDAGFIIVDYEGENDEYGVISALGINPRFQRKGIATALAYEAWRYIFQKGVKELRCEVFITNIGSLNFVTALGFEEYDIRVLDGE